MILDQNGGLWRISLSQNDQINRSNSLNLSKIEDRNVKSFGVGADFSVAFCSKEKIIEHRAEHEIQEKKPANSLLTKQENQSSKKSNLLKDLQNSSIIKDVLELRQLMNEMKDFRESLDDVLYDNHLNVMDSSSNEVLIGMESHRSSDPPPLLDDVHELRAHNKVLSDVIDELKRDFRQAIVNDLKREEHLKVLAKAYDDLEARFLRLLRMVESGNIILPREPFDNVQKDNTESLNNKLQSQQKTIEALHMENRRLLTELTTSNSQIEHLSELLESTQNKLASVTSSLSDCITQKTSYFLALSSKKSTNTPNVTSPTFGLLRSEEVPKYLADINNDTEAPIVKDQYLNETTVNHPKKLLFFDT